MAELARLFRRSMDVYKRNGIAALGLNSIDKAGVILMTPFYRARRSQKFFVMGNAKLPYFIHPYNATWRNERTIEIPVAKEFLNRRPASARVLEIGNVMAYYAPFPHTVVDKYERAVGVLNEDLITFRPNEKFDVVFSISTFEHIGWDEQPKQPEKVRQAIECFKALIKPGGLGMLTVPTGYNDYLDTMLSEENLGFDDTLFMRRTTATNDWEMTDWQGLKDLKYDGKFPAANGLFVGYIGCMRP